MTPARDRLNFHAIIGPNGMCRCGVKPDGTVETCGDLLDATVLHRMHAVFDAFIQQERHLPPGWSPMPMLRDFRDAMLTGWLTR